MIGLIAPVRFCEHSGACDQKIKPVDQAIQLIVCIIQIDAADGKNYVRRLCCLFATYGVVQGPTMRLPD